MNIITKLFAFGMVTVLVSLGIVFAQAALLTDHDEIPNNTFAMRVISNEFNLQCGIESGNWEVTDLGAGSVRFSFIICQNMGDIDFTYSMESVSTENILAGLLNLTIRDLGIDSEQVQCNSSFFDLVGPTDLYEGILGTVAGIPLLGVKGQTEPSNRLLVGDHSGLVGGSDEILCLKIEVNPFLTEAQELALSGMSTSITFKFDAEEVGGI